MDIGFHATISDRTCGVKQQVNNIIKIKVHVTRILLITLINEKNNFISFCIIIFFLCYG